MVLRPVNYFHHWHRWSDEEMALYAFGCVGGTAAWLLALAAAALDRRRATAIERAADAASRLMKGGLGGGTTGRSKGGEDASRRGSGTPKCSTPTLREPLLPTTAQ